jgi:hypothetical protein
VQERTWRYSGTPGASAGYTVASAVRIRGRLDVELLRRSLDRIVARHEALRTTFAEGAGGPVQIVHPPAPVELPLVERAGGAEADALLAREAAVPFDLERGPLLRLILVRVSEREHRLLRLNHHIVSDARSWKIFFAELAALYEAERRGEPPPLPQEELLQYADFAVWQRRTFTPDGRRWREEIEWWRQNLDGAPSRTPLPFARRTPDERAAVEDGVVDLGLPPEVSAELEGLRRKEGATFFMMRAAAYLALLASSTGANEVVVGTYVSTRRLSQTKDMFGFFSNLVTLRIRFHADASFRHWLSEVRPAVIEMSAHSEVPYEELCEDLRASDVTPPELTSIFSATDPMPRIRFADLEMTPLRRVFGSMPWGFTMGVDRNWEAERCMARFDARIHDPDAVRSFVERYGRLLESICADPDRPLGDLLPRRPV